MKGYKMIAIVALAGILLYACSKGSDGGDEGPAPDSFKKNMLINYADTLILPAYAELLARVTTFEESANNFLSNPSSSTQASLKEPFKNAYIAFEGVSALYFGPAAALQLNNSL